MRLWRQPLWTDAAQLPLSRWSALLTIDVPYAPPHFVREPGSAISYRRAMVRTLFSLGSLVLAALPLRAQEPPLPTDQRDYPDSINGCAPASVLNLLKFSDSRYRNAYDSLLGSEESVKMRYLVDRYFKGRASATYPGRKRWGLHGVDCGDLVLGLNELLGENELPPLSGSYLDRLPGENGADHLQRCRERIESSLRDGVMPLLSLRSFVVKRREKRENEPAWESAVHHYVLVTAVHDSGSPFGFDLEVIDPWEGRRTRLHLHRESHGQPFSALRGVEETGEWLSGTPFLQILAPEIATLRPKDLEWHERFIVVANFMITGP